MSGWGKSAYESWRIRQHSRYVLWAPWDEGFGNSTLCESYIHFLGYWWKTRNSPVSRIRYNPPTWDPEECYRQLDQFSEYLFRYDRNRVFALDEAQRYRLGTRGDFPPRFYHLLDEGRHHAISTHLIARRPVQVPPLARSLADEVIAFRLNSNNDVRALEDYFGDRAEEVKNLPKYHYLHYTAGREIQVCEPVNCPWLGEPK